MTGDARARRGERGVGAWEAQARKKPEAEAADSPTVELLEAVRLLSSAAEAHPLAGLAAEHDCWPSCRGPYLISARKRTRSRVRPGMRRSSRPSFPTSWVRGTGSTSTSTATRSAGQTSPKVTTRHRRRRRRALTSGLTQLNKYLSRAWYRAGISPQLHDDSSQAVYTTLLQQLGRGSFDSLVVDVGHSGIKDVFTRETSEGLAFFRAVDMVKKRAQRERVHHSLDALDVAGPSDLHGAGSARRQPCSRPSSNLEPARGRVIRDTLMGKSPAEIADQWGVAPKTVSNEKTRILQKLRLALADREMN